MSTYEDAVLAGERAAKAANFKRLAATGRELGTRELLMVFMDAFLAALPPSILIDGKVVEPWAVLEEWVGYPLDDDEKREFILAAREARHPREQWHDSNDQLRDHL